MSIKIIHREDTKAVCPKCGESNELKMWDKETMEQCASREQRRKYVSINEKRAGNGVYAYRCPSCAEWSSGGKILDSIND